MIAACIMKKFLPVLLVVVFPAYAEKPSIEKTKSWITHFFNSKVYSVQASSISNDCILNNTIETSELNPKPEKHAIDFRHIPASKIEILEKDKLLIMDGGKQSIVIKEGTNGEFLSKPLSVMYQLNDESMGPRIKKALDRLSVLCDASGLDDTF